MKQKLQTIGMAVAGIGLALSLVGFIALLGAAAWLETKAEERQ